MATAAVTQTKHPERTGQRDRLFFFGIALLVLIAVLVWTRRSLRRATICGVALMIILQLAVLPLARTALIGHTITYVGGKP